jgi:hypothetical protein
MEIQTLSLRIDLLGFEICNQNIALNALASMVYPMYAAYRATAAVASTAASTGEDFGIWAAVGGVFGIPLP